MKNILKLVLIITLAGLLAGCYPSTRRAAKGSAELSEIMSEADKIDNFSITLTLPEDYPSELPKIITAGLRFDRDAVFDKFAPGEPVEMNEYESDVYPGETLTWCAFNEDGDDYLRFEPEQLSRHSARVNELRYSELFSYPKDFSEQSLITYENEIEGFSSESAILRVREVVEMFGITNLGEPSVYGLSAEAANKYFHDGDAEDEYFGKEPAHRKFAKDDEAYYLRFPLVYEGIPRETNGVYVQDYSYDTVAYVEAIVTKDKILRLDCRGITSPEYKTGESVQINFTASDILRTIVSDHSSIVHTEKTVYYNCELVYAPEKFENGEWTLVPVWKFEYCTYGDMYNEYYENVVGELPTVAWITRDYYNANTGNLILWGY